MSSIEQLSKGYNQAQSELTQLVSSRQQLETQYQENKIVKEEFDKLEDDTKIYKQIGPVLMPQDQSEAKLNVDKRLEFIKREIDRVEEKIKNEQDRFAKARDQLVSARTEKMQQAAQLQQASAAQQKQ
ncbi:DEKNAAC105041 [Brettanomyces naardenensis]|uniref:DEKNAAC105041 n=1 Tax=Brettanomyces naardenensis TaxID=13370 RepID=A0A448YRW2_BRENA|nr:DEKNAAC105041 [Brettanomyces naardenensis]